jgi:hypothetical protein
MNEIHSDIPINEPLGYGFSYPKWGLCKITSRSYVGFDDPTAVGYNAM